MCFVVLLLGLASPLGASETHVLTPEIVLDLLSAADVQLSPDGSVVAYRLSRHRRADEPRGGRVGELWIVPAAGGTPSRIEATGWEAHTPRWSPDGTKLAWIARKDPGSAARIHAMDYPQGAVRSFESPAGDVELLSWSPDGSRIAYTAREAKTPEELEDEREGRDWVIVGSGYRHLRLYSADAANGTTTLVTRGERPHQADFLERSLGWFERYLGSETGAPP